MKSNGNLKVAIGHTGTHMSHVQVVIARRIKEAVRRRSSCESKCRSTGIVGTVSICKKLIRIEDKAQVRRGLRILKRRQSNLSVNGDFVPLIKVVIQGLHIPKGHVLCGDHIIC